MVVQFDQSQFASVFLKFKYVYKSPWDLVKMWSLIQPRACPSNKSPRERAGAHTQHLPVRSKPRSSLGICSKPPSLLFPSSSYLIGSLIYSPTDQLPITLLVLPHSLFSSTCLYFFGCAGSSMQHAGFSQLWHMGGFSSCSKQASLVENGLQSVQAQQLWHMGIVTPQYM